MANTVDNTLRKIGNTLESIFGNPTMQQPSTNGNGKQTQLEKIGMEARNYHLMRNEWNKSEEYLKPLVDAEYLVQTEFKIN